MFLSWLKRLFSASTPELTPEGDPVVLLPAIEAIKQGDAAKALALAEPFLKSKHKVVSLDALRLCALACSRLAQWDQANLYYLRLIRLDVSVHNALQVATTALMCGEIEHSRQQFDLAIELNEVRCEMPQGQMHTAYLSAVSQSGHLTEGFHHLEWLKRAMMAAPSLDSTFLMLNGLPFFEVFLEKSLPILRACLAPAELSAWYGEMRDKIDTDTRPLLDSFIEQLPAV